MTTHDILVAVFPLLLVLTACLFGAVAMLQPARWVRPISNRTFDVPKP